MEGLKTWITTICAGVFFITAVEMILPDNSLKKYAKFVLGLILMIIIINPLIKILNGTDINVSSYLNEYENILENEEEKSMKQKSNSIKNTQAVFEKNIERITLKTLKENYPKDNFEITVKTKYDKEENIFSIESINILFDEGGVKPVKKVEINKNTDENGGNKEIDNKKMKELIEKTLNIEEKAIHIYSTDK
ncbi:MULTISPECIES: stage III sporulation protein AF [Clostridium]|uniref:Stage III sporulation protein AF n=1 Tax=Clostridium cadaveris TaxID=1529 RepID=A0A1I2JAR8_9CLOT|nr:stage III sporulation protein AF [Clostridium cadaveris]MDU4953578.1 stage III sporulation protein AF [Clostridium sp.]MDM8313201.1 stage III sporulation protein AF [Clostridium cadaveris]MDY4948094.1 stage III sporulation protein AF [Clostridium cadaveris]NME63161.1 stage III sporulation protein AF [Clostridium cadaveris]NWK10301.1 stage III sporulation protein AF [Clostridium cadaveris]